MQWCPNSLLISRSHLSILTSLFIMHCTKQTPEILCLFILFFINPFKKTFVTYINWSLLHRRLDYKQILRWYYYYNSGDDELSGLYINITLVIPWFLIISLLHIWICNPWIHSTVLQATGWINKAIFHVEVWMQFSASLLCLRSFPWV